MHIYDTIIIGGGPGGYTAALYAARAGLDTLVLEKLYAGGQMALTSQIDNYPGFPEGVDGFTLGMQMQSAAERFGAKTELTEVLSADLHADPKAIHTAAGTFYGKTVVIATGASPKALGLEEEKALVGKGVSYCAHCDGMFYKDKVVAVVGGGNSAVADALILSRIAKKVILIHRRDTLRATKIYHQQLLAAPNIEFRWNSTVKKLLQNGQLTGIIIEDVNTQEQSAVDCDGIFVSIGRSPATDIFAGQVDTDSSGYIIADETTRTNIPGVFAVGDVRTKTLRQIVTAVADGAAAIEQAEHYLSHKEEII